MANLATWFTPSLQAISRSDGRSAVAAAAYRACAKLTDERTSLTHDFTPKAKRGLASNIYIGIPNNDIEKFWNDAEKIETRKNSRTARELMLPLSNEWNDNERRECVRDIAQHLRNQYGVAVMASIHRPNRNGQNDHAHILFTTRTVDAEGIFGKKTRVLDEGKTNGEIKKMREAVCDIVNQHAIKNNSAWYVYAGKFSDVIEDHVSTKHISITAGKNQKTYINANRKEVKEARAELAKIRVDEKAIATQIKELTTPPAATESSYNTAPALEDTSAGVIVSTTSKTLTQAEINEAAFLAEIERLNSPGYQEEEEQFIDYTEYMQSDSIRAANAKIAAELKSSSQTETNLDKALRLRAVFDKTEICRQQREDYKDLLAYRNRQLAELKDKKPGFLSLPATKKAHTRDIANSHAHILAAQALIDEQISYLQNKSVQQQSNEYCSNTSYRALAEQHDATLPLSEFEQMRAEKTKQLSLTRADCAEVAHALILSDKNIQDKAYELAYNNALHI